MQETKKHNQFELALEILSCNLSKKSVEDILMLVSVDISRRSLQRMLKFLAEKDYLFVEKEGQRYLYTLNKDIFRHKMQPGEAILLLLAQKNMNQLLPKNLSHSIDHLFEQAAVQNQSFAHKEWLQKVCAVSNAMPQLPPVLVEGVFETVSSALYFNKMLNITYRKSGVETRVYDLRPVGLIQQAHVIYLIVYNPENAIRSYALHRILAAESTHLFDRPPEFDLEQYANEYRHNYGEGQHVRLQFTILKDAAEHLLDSPLSLDQTADFLPEEQAYRITATVLDSVRLTRFILSFGQEVLEYRIDEVTV